MIVSNKKYSWSKKSFKYRFVKFSFFAILVVIGFSLLEWGMDTEISLGQQSYWMADLNTLKCTLMDEDLENWLDSRKKYGNPCDIFDFGPGKIAIICSNSSYFVAGTSPSECLEAGVMWRKKQNWK